MTVASAPVVASTFAYAYRLGEALESECANLFGYNTSF
jgi:hypothetical protein